MAHRPGIGALVATAAVTTAIAGCGGGSANTTTAGGSAKPGSAVAAAYRFSACMRDHGVPGFPDPQVTTAPGQTKIALHVGPWLHSPAFKAAGQACRHLLPGGGPGLRQDAAQSAARRAGLVAFAVCMRSHGFPRFPDPNGQGQLTLQTVTAAGIDLQAPGTRAAGLACVPASHGQVTRAAVEQATSAPQQVGAESGAQGGAQSAGAG